jgi:hypothetical protein
MTKSQRSAGDRPSTRVKISDPKLGREVRAKIGQQLRTMYDEVVKQGVPDRFVDLVQHLDKKDDGAG